MDYLPPELINFYINNQSMRENVKSYEKIVVEKSLNNSF